MRKTSVSGLAALATATILVGSSPALLPASSDPGGQAGHRSATLEGIVEPSETVEVVPDVAGHIGRMAVDIGSAVHRGDVLGEIESPALKLRAARARAALQQATARVVAAKCGVRVADQAVRTARAELQASQAGLTQVEATASVRRRQAARIAELVERGALQDRVGEEEQARVHGDEASEQAARARVAIVQASLASAEAKCDAARAAVAEMEEGLHLAELELEEARIRLEACRIRSPIDGIVTRRRHHVGEFVRPATGEASAPLFTVVRTGTVRVVAQVPEHESARVDVGDPARFRLVALPDREYQGAVSRTAYAEDPATHTMRVEIDLNNEDGRLRPGRRGTIRIELEPGS